jgi:hypothetical protein
MQRWRSHVLHHCELCNFVKAPCFFIVIGSDDEGSLALMNREVSFMTTDYQLIIIGGGRRPGSRNLRRPQ